MENSSLKEKTNHDSVPQTSGSSTPTNLLISDTYSVHPFDDLGHKVAFPNDFVNSNQDVHTSTQHNPICRENIDEYDDEMSFPDTSGSSTSTPTPPEEYVVKLQQAEVMIEKLKDENRHQRKEVV